MPLHSRRGLAIVVILLLIVLVLLVVVCTPRRPRCRRPESAYPPCPPQQLIVITTTLELVATVVSGIGTVVGVGTVGVIVPVSVSIRHDRYQLPPRHRRLHHRGQLGRRHISSSSS